MSAVVLIAAGLRAGQVQRIVSTAPSITETLFAMGLGARVVGDTIYCKFPAEAMNLPKIGNYLQPDVEAIVALHPDLVVVQKQSNHLGDELARLHIRYVEVESDNLEGVYAGARQIGRAADSSVNAERFIQDTQAQLESLGRLTRSLSKPSVAFIVGHNPGSLDGLFAASGSSYFSDLLRYAGATNIFSDAVTPYPTVSMEQILMRNPDIIIELADETAERQSEALLLWKKWPSLTAVKNKRVHGVASGPFLVPGPRAVIAARQLTHLLHPELQP